MCTCLGTWCAPFLDSSHSTRFELGQNGCLQGSLGAPAGALSSQLPVIAEGFLPFLGPKGAESHARLPDLASQLRKKDQNG